MIRSIRWKLLAWYASIVSIMTIAFGAITFTTFQHLLRDHVESELAAHAENLSRVIEPEGDNRFVIELTPDQVDLFSRDDDRGVYYRVWDSDHEIVDSSQPSLDIAYPATVGLRDTGEFSEYSLAGPAGSRILIGKSVLAERDQLRELAATFALVAVPILLILLLGGWLLSGKALEPIQRISQSASAVSETNLSQRIDVSRMEYELAALATTMNETFARLEASFDRQTRFTADASHELRTPLTTILAQCEQTLQFPRDTDEYRDAICSVHRAALRMRSIVNGLLTLARADSHQQTLECKPIKLDELVEPICHEFQPVAAEQQVRIETDLATVTVNADGDLLGEAVSNLLCNAIQYNRRGGEVRVTLQCDTKNALIRVADTGIGIAPEDCPHVFERFFRADPSRTKTALAGSGLGLAITKWIVEAHHGSISCRSNLQQGSTFTIELPANSTDNGPLR